MTTAEQLRAEFENVLRQEGVGYEIVDAKDNLMQFLIDAPGFDECEGLPLFVDFVEDENNAFLVSLGGPFARCTVDQFSEVMVRVNEYNQKYAWTKFFLEFVQDQRQDYAYLNVQIDAIVFPGTAGAECFHMLRMLVNTMNEVVEDLSQLVQFRVVNIGQGEEPKDEPSESELRAMLETIQKRLG